MKALQERLDIEKQTWEENYKKKEVCAALSCICSHSLLLFFILLNTLSVGSVLLTDM